MIKTHNKTGLRYLCVTKKDDYISYLGSGVYWKNHLKAYGKDVSTEVLIETENMSYISKIGYMVSVEFNIVKSNEWANLTYETGYDEKALNFKFWWENLDAIEKEKFVLSRNKSIKENHYMYSDNAAAVVKMISDSLKLHWLSLSLEEKEARMTPMWEGWKGWWISPTSEDYKIDLKQRAINQLIKKRLSYSDEEWSVEISRRRRELSEDKKKVRAAKCKVHYDEGKHDALFKRYSIERKGEGNPAAKRIMFNGVEYSTIREASIKTNTPYHKVRKLIKEIDNDKNRYIG